MSAEWASVVVDIVGIVVSIVGWWAAPWVERRMWESRNRSRPPSSAVYGGTYPGGIVYPVPAGGAQGTDLTQRAQKWLGSTALIVPTTMLAYAVIDVRVGAQYFDLAILPAAVLGLLYTTVTSLLLGPVGAGDQRAIRIAAKMCVVFDVLFSLTSILFAWFTFTALTHVLGIRYFVAELDSPVLTTLLAAVLAALSAIAWRTIDNSSDLLAALRR